MAQDEQPRLTAAEVLQRFKHEDLPAFAELALTDVNQVGIFGDLRFPRLRPPHYHLARHGNRHRESCCSVHSLV